MYGVYSDVILITDMWGLIIHKIMQINKAFLRIKHTKGAEVYFVTDAASFVQPNAVLLEKTKSGTGTTIYIKRPYLSKKLPLSYSESLYLKRANEVAEKESVDPRQHTGMVIVKSAKIVGQGANGSVYHNRNGCERQRLGIPTGERYDLCEGCNPKNHAEPKAIANAIENGHKDVLQGSTAYLWGHWWCCESCTNAMIDVGIKKVVLSKEFTKKFLSL